jgi:hypothetical protein
MSLSRHSATSRTAPTLACTAPISALSCDELAEALGWLHPRWMASAARVSPSWRLAVYAAVRLVARMRGLDMPSPSISITEDLLFALEVGAAAKKWVVASNAYHHVLLHRDAGVVISLEVVDERWSFWLRPDVNVRDGWDAPFSTDAISRNDSLDFSSSERYLVFRATRSVDTGVFGTFDRTTVASLEQVMRRGDSPEQFTGMLGEWKVFSTSGGGGVLIQNDRGYRGDDKLSASYRVLPLGAEAEGHSFVFCGGSVKRNVRYSMSGSPRK